MASATLAEIQILIRNLTNCVSPNQLSDSAINFAVNTFIAYDFPHRFNIRTLKTNVSWYTEAYRDAYFVDTSLPTEDPLYDFENRYTLVNTPIYISGIPAWFTQTREEFYNRFQKNEYIENIATGNGIVSTFTGKFTYFPVQQQTIIFNIQANVSTDPNFPTVDTITAIDFPDRDTDPNNLSSSVTYGTLRNQSTQQIYGVVNYITGDYTISFPYPALAGTNVVRQGCTYTPGKPTSLLYSYLQTIDEDTGQLVNKKSFQVRPIPDGAYVVNMEVYRNPVELINTDDTPELNQWWQYIAYGAARKIMQRRSDEDGLRRTLDEFTMQELLVNRKTILQQTQQRAATIYGDNNGLSYGWPGWGWPQNW